MKKRKVKKKVWVVLALIIIVAFLIYGGKKAYDDYKYKQTNEYKLLEVGYSNTETKLLLEKLDKKKIEELINSEKNEDIINFFKEKYFILKNLEEYLAYKKENNALSYSEVVTIINVNRNNDYYKDDHEANTSLNYSMLVNKYYKLSADYEPDDLVTIKTDHSWGAYGENKIRKDVYDAFKDMWTSAKESNIQLMINSSYRPYSDQERVYNNYKDKNGETFADKIAARPGYSEHQTGLALDIFCTTNSSTKTFADSEAYTWLLANAHKFGFILRYPEDKENITGYAFESWHYRYVGKELAAKIYNEGITFDEYYAYYIEK
ncbi:MAG: M15 family metallopeptidase [Bacilli bacterium]|nr:M15 family metallopeptidase [Bacilli bacterium]